MLSRQVMWQAHLYNQWNRIPAWSFIWAKRAKDSLEIIVEHEAKCNALENKPHFTKVVFLSPLCSGHEVGVILLHLDT